MVSGTHLLPEDSFKGEEMETWEESLQAKVWKISRIPNHPGHMGHRKQSHRLIHSHSSLADRRDKGGKDYLSITSQRQSQEKKRQFVEKGSKWLLSCLIDDWLVYFCSP